jgi:peptidoglycan/LPS O-acetylase OafA/YrhL
VRELDGLRGIAILLVLLAHGTAKAVSATAALQIALSLPMAVLHCVSTRGWVGVDLFFVLSGYLITGILLDTAGRPHYYRNFITRRAFRILPLYYTFLLVCLIPALHVSKELLLWHALYAGNIQNFLADNFGPYCISPLWSLQVEEQFYLLYRWLVKSVRATTLARLLFVALGGISYCVYLLHAPVLAVIGRLSPVFIPLPGGDLLEIFSACAITIAGAALSWRYFESPILKLKDRFAPNARAGAQSA